jgi:glycosyltransferase involved in cell wall biosynthesis
LGLDVFQYVRERVPVDLVGMGSEEIGGLGEVLHPQLPGFLKQYRFFFNPIRYTSLGLAVLEAMAIGLPIVGLATTEMAVVFENGITGWIHTDVDYLISKMKMLLQDPVAAMHMGEAGRKKVTGHFSITRFVKDWENILNKIVADSAITPGSHPP